ncbi:S4 domain-containing protein YaaA [Oenococcus kitaharae]|uniref:S4 domain-containing protein YaaA n=1 Tax=Oenococcus TaxID=46254 RepID=UPI000483B1AA|nr:S4 domain-containing protein YaaA [Oenococcus kitaharae]MCV3296209.1 S4 domain-containing protein YaaA [Oenococcus kitaharae]OEY84723.1 RNA-binding S4 protein [Oenococcus kitaharae]OEY85042.1 RNA-binding S4 protein [Oenococcus kitaharae]OEY85797.1 RNA-binding S4 protein [Oenococcus kitaharae]
MKKVQINTEFITLGQLLKIENIVDSGGSAKFFLRENPSSFFINGEADNRRGRKLRPGDMISIKQVGEYQIVSQ